MKCSDTFSRWLGVSGREDDLVLLSGEIRGSFQESVFFVEGRQRSYFGVCLGCALNVLHAGSAWVGENRTQSVGVRRWRGFPHPCTTRRAVSWPPPLLSPTRENFSKLVDSKVELKLTRALFSFSAAFVESPTRNLDWTRRAGTGGWTGGLARLLIYENADVLANWDQYSKKQDGDAIRRLIGTIGVSSPLSSLRKAFTSIRDAEEESVRTRNYRPSREKLHPKGGCRRVTESKTGAQTRDNSRRSQSTFQRGYLR